MSLHPTSAPSNAESLRAPRGADLLPRCTHIPPGCRDTKKTFPQQKLGEGVGGGVEDSKKLACRVGKARSFTSGMTSCIYAKGKGGGGNHSKNSCSRGRRWRSRLAVERPSQVSTSIVPANALLVQAKRKRKEERKKKNNDKNPPPPTKNLDDREMSWDGDYLPRPTRVRPSSSGLCYSLAKMNGGGGRGGCTDRLGEAGGGAGGGREVVMGGRR